jgi:hypothetical protein
LKCEPRAVERPETGSDITAKRQLICSKSLSNPDSLAGAIKIDAPRIVAAGYARSFDRHGNGNGRRLDLNARAASYRQRISGWRVGSASGP